MAGSYLNFPFDEDIFLQAWQEEPDPVRTALLTSGVMVDDPLIAAALQNDGNFYSIPYYKVLSGTPVNYDGATDITSTETSGDVQSGIAYGRAKGFTARDFVAELSGSDPMGHIVSSVGQYWNKYRQGLLIKILNGVFGITGDDDWKKHTVDLSAPAAPSPEAVTITATTLGDVATQVLGDNRGAFSLAIMHSAVANTLEKLQVLEYWKYTDANGIQRPMRIANANGFTVIIDDGVPTTATETDTNTTLGTYTTYLLGTGVLRRGAGRLDHPVELSRDPAKNGGQDTLYTRIRESIHPNGFSFKIPSSSWTNSPTDDQLSASANWVRKFDAKAIPMAKIVTNG